MQNQAIGFPGAIYEEYQEILSVSSSKNWAVFGYDKMSNDLRVVSSGDGGLEELADEWDDSKILYAFARVIEPISKLPKFVFISWCGDGVPVAKKGLFHHHLNDAGFHVHVNGRAEMDVSPDAIMKKVKDSSGAKYSIHDEPSKKVDVVAPVLSGTVASTSSVNAKSFAFITATFQAFSILPVNYADILQFSAGSTSACYDAAESNELSFLEGDIISEIEKVDDGWWQGKNRNGVVGLFPQNYVEEIKSNPSPSYGSAPPPLLNRPTFAAVTPSPSSVSPAAPLASPKKASNTQESYQPYMSSSANAWLSDDENATQKPAKTSPYSAGFPGSTPAEDKIAAEKDRREREDRELRERAEREAKEREEREKREAYEREERQKAAAAAAAATFATATAVIGSTASSGISATAIYQYDAQEDNEISFAEGELISEIEKTDEGWWQGRNAAGQVGLFPATYVEEIRGGGTTVPPPPPPPPPAAPAMPARPKGIIATAMYQYDAQEDNEISFVEGELITEIEKADEGWWQGKNAAGQIISLSFYTMIKSGAPVFVLMFAFLFKLEKPTWKLTGVILLICTGVALMVGGETKFDLRGYVEVQAATVLSGFRWSLTQILLAKASLGMSNPLATSIFLAPVMAVSLIIASAIMEDVRSLPSSALVVSAPGTLAAMLLFGGVLAFLMVMSEFQLIRVTNVVTFSVAGVFKEILTIVASSLVFDDGEWTVVKLCGLLLSLVGIALYNYFRITALQHAGPGHKENAAGASARHSYSAADDHALLVDGSSGVWTEDGDLMDSDDEAVAAIYGVGSLHGYSAVILGSGRKKPNVSAVELELQTVDPLFDSDEHDETMRS
ncbi:Triose-phosphate Transporter [Entophlyctis luteolus]|nr:Triose-phosphate Transporter [Entophlyctis luteolus]